MAKKESFFKLKKITIIELIIVICISSYMFFRSDPSVKAPDATAPTTENISDMSVRVDCAETYGNGVIYSADDSSLLILTAYHVVENGGELSVTLPDGKKSLASLVKQDSELDIAFLEISGMVQNDTTDRYLTVSTLPPAGKEDGAVAGKEIYVFDSVNKNSYKGTIAIPSVYSEDFGMDLILCYLKADPGMSGCGLFDSDMHFLGLLLGGTGKGGSVYIPSEKIKP